MAQEHVPLFRKLCEQKDVVVVSGAQASQIRTQIPESESRFFILGQTGNQALDKAGQTMWQEKFTEKQTSAIYELIEKMKSDFPPDVRDPNDLVENRGSQISYSPIGHHESLEKKYAFDPGNSRRRSVLAKYADDVDHIKNLGADVVPGGTTCFDFFLAGKNKGFNVARLIKHEGWNKKDCVYLGDALFPGGNDETVVGVIETHSVKDPDDTFIHIAQYLV